MQCFCTIFYASVQNTPVIFVEDISLSWGKKKDHVDPVFATVVSELYSGVTCPRAKGYVSVQTSSNLVAELFGGFFFFALPPVIYFFSN